MTPNKPTLAGHLSQLMLDGRVTDNRVYGVQAPHKKKGKRTGMQGAAGTNTGSGKNKPLMGAATGVKPSKADVNQGAVLQTKMPKVGAAVSGKPKLRSPFQQAYSDAKNALNTSTDSRAKAAGAKPTKGSTAKTKGAGVD